MPEPDRYEFDLAMGWTFPRGFPEEHRRAVGDGLYLEEEPMPGATDALTALMDRGWRITVMTSRSERGALEQTREWLDSHAIPYDRLQYGKDTDAFIRIDDDPAALTRLAALPHPGLTLAYDHAYNRRWPGIRLSGWTPPDPVPRHLPGRGRVRTA